MDLEKVLANRDTAIALVRLIEFKKCVRPLTLNVVIGEENFKLRGDTLGERVQRVWKTLITNKFGTQVSWVGQKGKPPVLN